MRIIVLANTVHTNTLTGGDKIFVECAKKWIAWGHNVTIVTNEVGATYCKERGVTAKHVVVWGASVSDRFGVYVAMITKAILSLVRSPLLASKKADIIFGSSFFFPDMIPAYILKLRNPNAALVTACYLFSTEKWGADYSGGRLKGLLFYLNEQIAFFLLRKKDGLVLTASEFDRRQFIASQHFPARYVLALRGGVDTAFFQTVPKPSLTYDAVFVGRFHPQKCIPELIDIWGQVVAQDRTRLLALVGGGPQEKELRALVRKKKLSKNVLFLGVADGVVKTKILKSSRLFVSASRFDSGNIALDEAMGCEIPGIVYDLPRLYYPQGVIKVSVGDQKAFVQAILSLVANEKRRKQLGEEAAAFARSIDWEEKAKELLTFMKKGATINA